MPLYSKILVTSAKGGVGKSTTALGLSAAFARNGKKVLLCDLDIASRSLDMLTGTEDKSIFNFGDVIKNPADIQRAEIVPFEEIPQLSIITAPVSEYLSEMSEEDGCDVKTLIRRGINNLIENGDFDILICDSGGGCDIAVAVCDLFDFVAVTSEQSRTSVRAAEYAAELLKKAGAGVIRVVICGFDLTSVRREYRAGIIEIVDESTLRCVGVVPFDRKLQKYQDKGVRPPAKNLSTKAYENIMRRISGYDVPLFDGMRKLRRTRKKAF